MHVEYGTLQFGALARKETELGNAIKTEAHKISEAQSLVFLKITYHMGMSFAKEKEGKDILCPQEA